MTLEARRQQLVAELGVLMDTVVSPATFSQRDTNGNAPAGSLLAELEHQLEEKTAELEALNARMNRFSYRLWNVSRALLFLVWISAVALLFCTFTLAPAIGAGYQLVFGLLAMLNLVWAIWASIPQKV